MSRRLGSRIGLGLLSVAGTSAAHFLSYFIAAPDSHHRNELLESTGHAGESPFLTVAIAAVMATCIAVLAGRSRERSPRFLPAFATLVVLQTLGFVGLEVTERVLVDASLIEAAHEPIFVLGLGAQLVVAALGALILRTLHVAASATTARPPLPALVACLAIPYATHLPSIAVLRRWDARGPPHFS